MLFAEIIYYLRICQLYSKYHTLRAGTHIDKY